MTEYLDKLKDPRWQKKRLEIFERDGWTCKKCEDSESTLHIHHLVYLNGKDPWEIPDGFLITLCQKCHEENNPDLLNLIGILLDTIWRDDWKFGNRRYQEQLTNVTHILL
jgi:hypothetical protein